MANCNETLTFLTERRRMCKTYGCSERCPFTGHLISCVRLLDKDPELAIGVVQKWSDENPDPEGDKA